MADPTLVPPDVNTAFLSIGTLTLNPDGTGVFNAHYEVRHESNHSVLMGAEDSAYAVTYVRDGMDLKISWKGVAGNGQIFPGMLRSGQGSPGAPGCHPRALRSDSISALSVSGIRADQTARRS